MKSGRRLHGSARLRLESLEPRHMLAVAEPNNSFDSASVDPRNIYGATAYSNADSVSPGDTTDYYKFFTLYGPAHVSVLVVAPTPSVDAYVYNQNQALIGFDPNPGRSRYIANVYVPGSQYFYVRVNNVPFGASTYSITVQVDYDLGDTAATAQDVGTSWGQTSDHYAAYNPTGWQGSLGFLPNDSVDWWKVRMESEGSITARFISGDNIEADVQLYDGNLALLRSARTVNGRASVYPFSTVPAGTYFVKLAQVSGGGNYTLRITSDYAGARTGSARDLGDLTGSSRQMHDMVGSPFLPSYEDETDLYKFSLSRTAPVDFLGTIDTSTFPAPTFGATFALAKDSNGNGVIEAGEIFKSFTTNAKASQTLAAGTYYVVVQQKGLYTSYSIDLDSDFDAVNGDARAWNNMTQAQDLSWLTTTRTLRNGFGISAGDISDFYKFKLSATRRVVASSTIIAALSRDTTKPNLTIVKDKNGNGRYDAGEELVPFGKSLSATLGAGTYFLYVQSPTGRQTTYSVSFGPG